MIRRIPWWLGGLLMALLLGALVAVSILLPLRQAFDEADLNRLG
ncbi:hypothetical protein WCX18_01660 [Sulfurimonas sp. HSL1-2]